MKYIIKPNYHEWGSGGGGGCTGNCNANCRTLHGCNNGPSICSTKFL